MIEDLPDPRPYLPTLSHLFGLKPRDIDDLTALEYLTYIHAAQNWGSP